MSREDIIRMARQTRLLPEWVELCRKDEEALVRFADLIAAAEREACAKLAESTVCDTHLPTGVRIYGTRAADAIRARNNT